MSRRAVSLKVVVEKVGSVRILRLQGRIVIGETTVLRIAVLSQAHAGSVVLDLARVNYVDARGLGALLELREWTQSRGIEFTLVNVTRLVKEVLAITRLDTVFKISTSPTRWNCKSSEHPRANTHKPLASRLVRTKGLDPVGVNIENREMKHPQGNA